MKPRPTRRARPREPHATTPDAPTSRLHEPAASTLDPSHLDELHLAPRAPAPDAPSVDELELGRGAGGRVVRGPDRHLVREVAWKIARGAHARRRLEHEARALAALEHPAIIPIHDLVDEPDGSLRIALRMVRGETLHVVSRRATDRDARLRLLRPFLQAVEGVAWAHRLGWVHRDLKPANIMVGDLGETQVIDWGLALCLDDGPLEPPGTIVGTALTMSPEQARGEAIDARADVWGLGATLFEVLTGHALFAETDPRAVVSTLSTLTVPLVDPSGTTPDLAPYPAELVAILARALSPDVDARYPDAGALAKDLSAFLDGRIVSAHTYRPLDHLRRFARAYRLPIGIALAVLATAAIAAVLAIVEIDRERDEAIAARTRADLARQEAIQALSSRDLEVARRGVTEARRELADLQRPEAELAAARTLSIEEDPEARGVIAAFAHAPRPVREATRAAPRDCIDADLSPDGETFLCGDRQSLAVQRGDLLWRLDRPYRQAVLTARGALVLVNFREDALTAYDAATGRVRHTLGASRCRGLLRADPAGSRTLNRGQACAEVIDGPVVSDLDPCDGQHVEVAAIDALGVVAALCIGGDLAVISPDGSRRRVASEIGLDADTLLAATLVHLPMRDGSLARDALLVGSSAGEILAIDLRDGHIAKRQTMTPNGVISALEVSADGRFVLSSMEGQGITVLDASTLALVTRLPRDASFARFVAAPPPDDRAPRRPEPPTAATLVSGAFDLPGGHATLSRWRLPDGPSMRIEGLGGVTSLALPRADLLLVTHDSSASLIDPADGHTRASATWVEVIAKAAVLDRAGTVQVAIAGRMGGEPLRALAPGDPTLGQHSSATPSAESGQPGSARPWAVTTRFDEVAAHRRLFALTGDRMIGARTGLGASIWTPDRADRLEFMQDQLIDLAGSDTFAAFLTERPIVAGLVDLAADPVELGRCPAPSAIALALAPSHAPRGEPDVLLVNPSLVERMRLSDCALTAVYAARGHELTRAIATPDGRFVMAGTRAGSVLVWREDGSLIGRVDLHRAAVTALALDPGATTLYTGAWDGHVSTLDLETFDTPRDALVSAIRGTWEALMAPPAR